VNGRKLRLVALDDGYEPERTRAVMKDLADTRNVFGFIGNVGTPTAEVAVPFTLEKRMLLLRPFHRSGPARGIRRRIFTRAARGDRRRP